VITLASRATAGSAWTAAGFTAVRRHVVAARNVENNIRRFI
jgi:hypothetical protein